MLIAAVAAGLAFGWPVLVVILGIVVMIFLHELGHYVTAKWAGMKVTEFFIGFGPKIWSFRRGETEYGLKVVPGGAYVRIIGMNNLDDVDPSTSQDVPAEVLPQAPARGQCRIAHALRAGVRAARDPARCCRLPRPERRQPTRPSPGVADQHGGGRQRRPGRRPGGRSGRRRQRAAGVALRRAVRRPRRFDVGDEVQLTVERTGSSAPSMPRCGFRPAGEPGGDAGTPFLGVGTSKHFSDEPSASGPPSCGRRARWCGSPARPSAPWRVLQPPRHQQLRRQRGRGQQPRLGLKGSGGSGSSSDNNDRLISIIGVVQLGSQDVENRAAFLLALFFSLNMFIGIFNMLPLLPLDRHAAMAVYERIRSLGQAYHADFAKLLPLTYAVVMGLVVLGVTAMYLDIVDPISG